MNCENFQSARVVCPFLRSNLSYFINLHHFCRVQAAFRVCLLLVASFGQLFHVRFRQFIDPSLASPAHLFSDSDFSCVSAPSVQFLGILRVHQQIFSISRRFIIVLATADRILRLHQQDFQYFSTFHHHFLEDCQEFARISRYFRVSSAHHRFRVQIPCVFSLAWCLCRCFALLDCFSRVYLAISFGPSIPPSLFSRFSVVFSVGLHVTLCG